MPRCLRSSERDALEIRLADAARVFVTTVSSAVFRVQRFDAFLLDMLTMMAIQDILASERASLDYSSYKWGRNRRELRLRSWWQEVSCLAR